MLRKMMIACTLAALAAPAFAQSAPAQVQETCGIFVRQDEEHVSYIPIPGYSVITAALPLTKPAGQPQVDGVICDRVSLFLSPHDHRVLTDLHVPFYVRSGIRLVALEVAEGQLRVRFLRGEPLESERAALAAALDQAQQAAAGGH